MKKILLFVPVLLLFVGCPSIPEGPNSIVGQWAIHATNGDSPMTFRSNGTFTTPSMAGDTLSGTFSMDEEGLVHGFYSNGYSTGSVSMSFVFTVSGDSLSGTIAMSVCETGQECEHSSANVTGTRLVSKSDELEIPAIISQ